MGQDKVFEWFKKQRESGCQDWFCLSTVAKRFRARRNTGKAVSIRRAIVKLWADGKLDMVSPNLWHRYYRLNDKYLDDFKLMLK